MACYVADRPGGFTERELADLSALSERLSVIVDMNSQRQIAENVLTAYLGPQTGPKVLAGQIRRGSGQAIAAVLWSSDLRRFTHLSDHLPAERLHRHPQPAVRSAGEGDHKPRRRDPEICRRRTARHFPVAVPADAERAAGNALAAAKETLAALREQTPRKANRRSKSSSHSTTARSFTAMSVPPIVSTSP